MKLTQFWNAIINNEVDKKTDKWSLPNGLVWLNGLKIMYIRESYITLADMILSGDNSELVAMLILGSKGIGKTVFLNYLMVRIAEKAAKENNLKTLSISYLYRVTGSKDICLKFTAQGVVISDNALVSDYFLSDSVDIYNGELGSRVLLEVA
jgi:Cdc6-like AAA superfamily ATPase